MGEALTQQREDQEQLDLITNPTEAQRAEADALSAAQQQTPEGNVNDDGALFGLEGLEVVAPAATPEESTAENTQLHPGQRMLPGMPHTNTERLGVRGLNWTSRVAGRIADLSYRVAGFAESVHGAAEDNRLGLTARAARRAANGATHIKNAANSVNDVAESQSDKLAARRTAGEVARDTKDTLEDQIQAGRRLAGRIGRAIKNETIALGNDFKTNFNEVRDANRGNVQKVREALGQRATAARQRRAERSEAARQERAKREALKRENRLTPDEQAAKNQAMAEVKAQARAERERAQRRADQNKALERLAARYQREQKRKETMEEVKQHARKAGKVALVGAGLVIASPVLAPAAVAYAGGKAAKKSYEVGVDVAKKSSAFMKDKADDLSYTYHAAQAARRYENAQAQKDAADKSLKKSGVAQQRQRNRS